MVTCRGLGGRIARPARANQPWAIESYALCEQISPGQSNRSPCAGKSNLGGRITRPAKTNRPWVVESHALREQIEPSPCASNSTMGARTIRSARANGPWMVEGVPDPPPRAPPPSHRMAARANRPWVIESVALREQIGPGWSNHSPRASKSILGGRIPRPACAKLISCLGTEAVNLVLRSSNSRGASASGAPLAR